MHTLPRPMNIDELIAARKPPAGAVDCYPDVLYSSMWYPAAGQPIGQPLGFFQGLESPTAGGTVGAAAGDLSMTNVKQGFLVSQKFHALYAFIVPVVENFWNDDVADAAGVVRDLDRILKTNRGFVSYSYSVTNKVRGPFPLDAFGEMGAIMPDFGGTSAPAAGHGSVLQHVRTSAHGGWPLNLIIFENESFPFNLTWGVATAVNAAMLLRMVLFGWRYVANAA